MKKIEFLNILAARLQSLPPKEVQRSVSYYMEMIDDRIEDGMSEEEAVAALGNIDDIVNNILLDIPLPTLMKSKMKPKDGLRAWQIVLIICGFPIWLPFLLAFFIIILAVYVCIWAVIVSLFAVVAALLFGGIFGIFCTPFVFQSGLAPGVFLLGCAIVLIGTSMISFFGVLKLSNWLISFTGYFLKWVKSLFVRKEQN